VARVGVAIAVSCGSVYWCPALLIDGAKTIALAAVVEFLIIRCHAITKLFKPTFYWLHEVVQRGQRWWAALVLPLHRKGNANEVFALPLMSL
jgi:hypothetical protein